MPDADPPSGSDAPETSSGRLVDLGFQALPAIGSAIGFVGFVALVGSAIAWAQFHAVGLPADQAVRVMARQDLVATGALPLFAFVALGALAVAVAYVGRDEAGGFGAGLGLYLLAAAETIIAFVWVANATYTWAVAGWVLVTAVLLAVLLSSDGPTPALVPPMRPRRGAGATRPRRRPARRRDEILAWILRVLVVAAVALLLLDETTRWLGITVVSAIVVNLLVFALKRRARFGFYLAAVFLSVSVVGGVATVVRAHTQPRLHPVVVLRKEDGVALCGVLISETDKRVYLGDLGAAPDDRDPRSGEDENRVGSIYWVPDGDVDMLRIGSAVSADQVASAAQALAARVYADRAEEHPKAAAPTTTVVTNARTGTVTTTTSRPGSEEPTLQPAAEPPCTAPGEATRTIAYSR